MEEMDSSPNVDEKAIPTTQREKIVCFGIVKYRQAKGVRLGTIFGIDLDQSMDDYFMTGDKVNDTRINKTKQLLKWFVEQKSRWNPQHEFAVMILGEMAVWHMDFTSDAMLLSHAIDELYTMGKFTAFDTTTLFKEM
ncbi:BTB and MATH domain-containing protein 41 [Mortierella claussenii]|nr:BTB and MATH domain-containing protein 41 [Mortierella claussenii]